MALVFSPTLADRYLSKVDQRGPDECWPWLAGLAQRYGHGLIYVGKKDGSGTSWAAHRVGWLVRNGEAPGEKVVRHRCDWPPCQNPAHWILGTQADNVADMYERGRARNVGRPGEKHHAARLTGAQVADIRHRYAEGGILQRELAAEYGVGKAQIGKIIRGDRWASVA